MGHKGLVAQTVGEEDERGRRLFYDIRRISRRKMDPSHDLCPRTATLATRLVPTAYRADYLGKTEEGTLH